MGLLKCFIFFIIVLVTGKQNSLMPLQEITSTNETEYLAPKKMNFFKTAYSGARNDWNGEVGYEFTVKHEFKVTALGRSIFSTNKLLGDAIVTIWNSATSQKITSAIVGLSSIVENGYGYTVLSTPVTLAQGKYRITQRCLYGMPDKWNDASQTANYNSYFATFDQGVYSTTNGVYPSYSDGAGRRPGMVTFYVEG